MAKIKEPEDLGEFLIRTLKLDEDKYLFENLKDDEYLLKIKDDSTKQGLTEKTLKTLSQMYVEKKGYSLFEVENEFMYFKNKWNRNLKISVTSSNFGNHFIYTISYKKAV